MALPDAPVAGRGGVGRAAGGGQRVITLIIIKGLIVIAIIIIPWIIIEKRIAAEDVILEAEIEQLGRDYAMREKEILRGMQEQEAWRDKLLRRNDG